MTLFKENLRPDNVNGAGAADPCGVRQNPESNKSIAAAFGFLRNKEACLADRVEVDGLERERAFIQPVLQFGVGVGSAGYADRIEIFSRNRLGWKDLEL